MPAVMSSKRLMNRRFNIFPTLVYCVDCMDLVDDVESILKYAKWEEGNNISNDQKILFKYNMGLVERIEDKINECLSEIRYEVPFKMTTSWFNRLNMHQSQREHYHTNSSWSSVFYFSKSVKDNSSITFCKRNPSINPKSNSTDVDLVMSGDVNFPANYGEMLVFPSDLSHAVQINNNKETRYSIAMNFMPFGQCGMLDSFYDYR